MATQDVTIWDEDNTKAVSVVTDTANVDRLAVDSIGRDADHEYIEQGLFWNVNTFNENLGNNAVIKFVMTTGDTPVHITWEYYLALQGYFTFEEDVTIVTPGTPLTIFNRQRASANTPEAVVEEGTIYGTVGSTTITEIHFGANGGVKASGGGASLGEWILKPNSIYLFQLVSEKSSNKGALSLNWYEEDT